MKPKHRKKPGISRNLLEGQSYKRTLWIYCDPYKTGFELVQFSNSYDWWVRDWPGIEWETETIRRIWELKKVVPHVPEAWNNLTLCHKALRLLSEEQGVGGPMHFHETLEYQKGRYRTIISDLFRQFWADLHKKYRRRMILLPHWRLKTIPPLESISEEMTGELADFFKDPDPEGGIWLTMVDRFKTLCELIDRDTLTTYLVSHGYQPPAPSGALVIVDTGQLTECH